MLWLRWRTWGRTDARGEGRESQLGHVSLGMTGSHPKGNGVPVKKSVESSGLGGGGCESLELLDGSESWSS